MTDTNCDLVVNKYTGRVLKAGTRSHINYLKKVKREEEDEILIKKQVLNARKRAILKENGFGSDDDEPPKPKIKVKNPKPKPKGNARARAAMGKLNEVLETIGDDTEDADEKLMKMFESLLE